MLQLPQLKSRGGHGPVWPAANLLNHSVGSALNSGPVGSRSFHFGEKVFNADDKRLSISRLGEAEGHGQDIYVGTCLPGLHS